ncbi:MAG: flagellar basal body-associated FliL family protein [Archaeoglobaceae archaeon]
MNQKAQLILLILCLGLTVINTVILTTNFITARKFVTEIDKLITQAIDQLAKTIESFNSSQFQAIDSKNYELISPGSFTTFFLKDKAVAVIGSISFNLANEACKLRLDREKDRIMDALMTLFLQKSRDELSTASGVELLKSQIKNTVNKIIGCTETNGVKGVYLYIKAVSSTD